MCDEGLKTVMFEIDPDALSVTEAARLPAAAGGSKTTRGGIAVSNFIVVPSEDVSIEISLVAESMVVDSGAPFCTISSSTIRTSA